MNVNQGIQMNGVAPPRTGRDGVDPEGLQVFGDEKVDILRETRGSGAGNAPFKIMCLIYGSYPTL